MALPFTSNFINLVLSLWVNWLVWLDLFVFSKTKSLLFFIFCIFYFCFISFCLDGHYLFQPADVQFAIFRQFLRCVIYLLKTHL